MSPRPAASRNRYDERSAIARLLDLRRLRERSALDALTQCEGDCRRAEQQVEAARNAVAHHLAEARTHEQGKRQALVGRAVSAAEIARLQADLDAMAAETYGCARSRRKRERRCTMPSWRVTPPASATVFASAR